MWLSLLLLSALLLPHDPQDARFSTTRTSPIVLPLPDEQDAFFFVVFGDRTTGPTEGSRYSRRPWTRSTCSRPTS
ncbi:MAG: hypothetical protein IPJ19_10455 [Planctomycetes bacterium]|nr:hypothetical protein [Planctomycetota bacterium]